MWIIPILGITQNWPKKHWPLLGLEIFWSLFTFTWLRFFWNFVLNFYLADILKWIHSPQPGLFLVANFRHLQGLQFVKGFLGLSKGLKISYFKGEGGGREKLDSPYLDQSFLYGVWIVFYFSLLTSSQIWLSALVNDCQSTSPGAPHLPFPPSSRGPYRIMMTNY